MIVGASVSTAPVSRAFKELLPLLPNSTVPVPDRVCVPLKYNCAAVAPTCAPHAGRAVEHEAVLHKRKRAIVLRQVQISIRRHPVQRSTTGGEYQGLTAGTVEQRGALESSTRQSKQTVHLDIVGNGECSPCERERIVAGQTSDGHRTLAKLHRRSGVSSVD